MPSLVEVRFNMKATVLVGAQVSGVAIAGRFIAVQNPDTGAIEDKWVASDNFQRVNWSDDPNTTDIEAFDIICEFRGVIAAGIRGSATAETFGKDYLKIDITKMRFPKRYSITAHDRVVNVRDRLTGSPIWKEQETLNPPVWDVRGVTPILDPLGRLTDYYALVQRVQNQ